MTSTAPLAGFAFRVSADLMPKGPCTETVYTLTPKYRYRGYIKAKVYTIWAHGPLGDAYVSDIVGGPHPTASLPSSRREVCQALCLLPPRWAGKRGGGRFELKYVNRNLRHVLDNYHLHKFSTSVQDLESCVHLNNPPCSSIAIRAS